MTSQKTGFGKVWEVLGSFWEVNMADADAESVFGKRLGSIWEVMGRFVQASQNLKRCFGKYGFPSYGNLTFWEDLGSYGTFLYISQSEQLRYGTPLVYRLMQSSQGYDCVYKHKLDEVQLFQLLAWSPIHLHSALPTPT